MPDMLLVEADIVKGQAHNFSIGQKWLLELYCLFAARPWGASYRVFLVSVGGNFYFLIEILT